MKNIVLIGPSGIGKTTVGTHIYKKYGFKHIDTDDLIQSIYNTNISEIFKNYGESYFRKLETNVVKSISNSKNTVISTGGGVVLNEDNIINLKTNGIIFLLFGKIETIINNLKSSSEERPLIGNNKDCFENVRSMYLGRKTLYISSSDYIINVDFKSISQIADEIIFHYKQHLSCSN